MAGTAQMCVYVCMYICVYVCVSKVLLFVWGFDLQLHIYKDRCIPHGKPYLCSKRSPESIRLHVCVYLFVCVKCLCLCRLLIYDRHVYSMRGPRRASSKRLSSDSRAKIRLMLETRTGESHICILDGARRASAYMFVCIYVCLYIYTYIYIHRYTLYIYIYT